MATSDILPFAQGAGANNLTQSAYQSDAQRLTGNQPGVARAQLVNKALLQSSFVAAAVARFMADLQSTNITDQIDVAGAANILKIAVRAAAAEDWTASGRQNKAQLNGYQRMPGGMILQWGGTVMPNTGGIQSSVNVTFPVALAAPAYVCLPLTLESMHTSGYFPALAVPVTSATGATIQASLTSGINKGAIVGWFALGY